MSEKVNALDFLEQPLAGLPVVVVVFGPQRYLQSLVIDRMTGVVRNRESTDSGAGDEEGAFAVTLDGARAGWVDLVDQLNSRSLFGDESKLVLLRDADDFIRNHREKLEDFLGGRKAGDVPLVIAPTSWAAGTRLYKQTVKTGWTIQCDLPTAPSTRSAGPDLARIGKWLMARAGSFHGFRIELDACRLLFELCDEEFGRADQELARLALYVSNNEVVDRKMVQSVVGGWRSQTMFEAIDAAVDGQAAHALQLIDRLLMAGEHPLSLFGQLAWSLRRYALALRILDRLPGGGKRGAMGTALQQAGFRSFRGELERAEPRMRRLGRGRVEQLSRVLLEIDRSLKGSHSHEERGRLALEKLVFWLA